MMKAICKFMCSLCPFAELAGRAGLALVFLVGGIGKIPGYEGTLGYMESKGVPGELLPLVIILEIAAPIAIMIGWQTRWAALALAGFTVLTVLLFHFDFADRAMLKNIAITGGLLVLACAGAGRFSIDRRRAAARPG